MSIKLKDTANITATSASSATSATKLQTTRAINGTNFDGTGNITTANWGTARNLNGVSVNGSTNYTIPVENYYCNVGDNNTNLYHRILTTDIATANWVDKSLIIVMHSGYNGGGFGIAKITFRTNDISSAANSQGEIKWLVRNGFAANALVFNFVNQSKNACMDVFYKSPGTYAGMTWYVLSEGGRGGAHSKQWTKYNTNASGTNAYTEANMKTLRTYTSTLVSATDAGHVSTANSANTLATARTINGTSFNGSGNITTANWGTARNLQIGNTAKSVNGSANVSWSLSEIGAAAASHTHAYAPTATGSSISIHADSDSSSTSEYLLLKAGHNELKIASSAGGTTVTKGQDKLTFNGNIVYHAGRKPTVSEIGAAASNHTHNNITSRGKVTCETGVSGRPAVAGLSMSEAYNNGYPDTYGNVINLRGQGDGQIFVGWSGNDGAHAPVYVRSKRDNTNTANWSGWAQFYTTANPQTTITGNAGTATKLQTARTINGTNFDGTGNITTANWGTARNIQIGNTSKSVNGSANVTWTLGDIGAAASNHTHGLVNLNSEAFSGGNDLNTYNSTKTWVARTLNSTTNKPADYFTVVNFGANANSNFQLAHSYANSSTLYVRGRHDTSGNYTPWAKIYTDKNKPTASDIGAAAASSVGTLSSLKTSAKGNLVDAINEVFQSADSARSSLVSAIGSPLTSTDTLASIATKLQSKKQELGTAAAKVVNGVSSSTNLNTIVSTLNGYKPYVGRAHTLYVDFNGGKTVYIEPQKTNGSTTMKQGSAWMAMIKDVGAKRDYCLCTDSSYGFPNKTKDANNAVTFSIDSSGEVSISCSTYTSKTYKIMLSSINATYSEIDETESSSYYYVVKTLEEKDEEEGRKDEESNC